MTITDSTKGRFLLTDAAQSWRVERGCADVFLVDVENGAARGPIYHVLTVVEGETIAGTGAAEWEGRRVSLLCQPQPGAMFSSSGHGGQGSQELSGWRMRLLEAAELEDGVEGGEEVSSDEALLRALARKRDREENAETERLRRKTAARDAAVRDALRELTTVVEDAVPTEAAQALEAPVVSACQALGRQLGIKIKAPRGFVPTADLLRDVGLLCRASGVRFREVSLNGQWWKQDNGPLLGFRIAKDESQPPVPVVLLRRGGGYRVQDAEGGGMQPLTRTLAAELSATAVVFYRPFPHRALSWRDLLWFGLFDTRRDVVTVVGIGAATGLLALVIPVATGILFDTIIPGAQKHQLYQMAALLITASVVTFLISLSSSAAMLRMEGRMEASIQSAVWDRLLSLPVRFFKQYNSGDLVERSLAINQIRKMLTGAVVNSMLSGIFSIFSFLLLFKYSLRLALAATGLALVAGAVSILSGWLQRRYAWRSYEISGKISGQVLETMNGIAKLRMAGAESQAFARWAELFAGERRIAVNSSRVTTAVGMFNAVFPTITGAVIFYFGLKLMEGNAGLTPGSFVAFYTAFGQFLAAALGLSNTAISVIGILPAYRRATPILEAIPEVGGNKVAPGRLRGNIDVSRVTFRYNEDLPLVLNDVSFQIKPGEFVAFVGASGSGKSTMFRLLLGFEKAESGFIYYDGMDLDEMDPQELRRQMGVVLQNGRVLSGDIFTNIVGSAPLTEQDAWAAARSAGLDRDIEAMPMKMHTVLSEGGGGLSGGQRQRLLIARAIVHRPRMLLFDEATSALDNQTQAIVSESLEKLNATRIVIAHRLSTIMHADRIFVFDAGRIVQQGSYAELMEQDGPFRELASRQIA